MSRRLDQVLACWSVAYKGQGVIAKVNYPERGRIGCGVYGPAGGLMEAFDFHDDLNFPTPT